MSAHNRTLPGEPDDPGLAGIGLASFRIAQRARRKAAVVGKEIRTGKMLAVQPSGGPAVAERVSGPAAWGTRASRTDDGRWIYEKR